MKKQTCLNCFILPDTFIVSAAIVAKSSAPVILETRLVGLLGKAILSPLFPQLDNRIHLKHCPPTQVSEVKVKFFEIEC